MNADLPRRTRSYQNHHLDSSRWDAFRLRSDDVVISTSYKAGTTWTQTIVSQLIFQNEPWPADLHDMSPWIDFRGPPLDPIMDAVHAQSHRRFLKTHLPLDGIPYFPEVRYVVVARDGRDVFMSFLNHFGNYRPEMFEFLNGTPGRVGDPLDPYDGDLHALFRNWLHRGWFEWEKDGYPFWSFFHHLQTWWDYRHLPNLLFVHYDDLSDDLDGEMRRIADFLGVHPPPELWPELVERCTFEHMKREAEKHSPRAGMGFVGGAQTFIYKGTNGRWRGVLDDQELADYDRAVAERLSPDCARWLAEGRKALGGTPPSLG